MSGFALILNRNGEPVSPEALDAILSRLAHRGPDGSHAQVAESIGMSCQHFWVTPEDVNIRQPLVDRSGRYHILFDGRLDNRTEILSALGSNSLALKSSPDAELVLEAFLKWGDACFAHLMGPMAVAIVDGVERRVTLMRDAVGSRTVFYYLSPTLLIAASEPYAILAHPGIPLELDEVTIARWYAVMPPSIGASFFANVNELLPAHIIAIEPDKAILWRYWDIEPEKRIHYYQDEEYTEHFLDLLTKSVTCRLRATTSIGISMSGGYDSTSVAALAALDLASPPRQEPPVSFSWIFDELDECDERPAIQIVNKHFNTKPVYILGDDAWPLRDWECWPHNPNMPEGNPYRLLRQKLYQAANRANTRVILTGLYGSEAFQGSDYWLAELVKERRLAPALAGLADQIRRHGLADPFVRASLSRVSSFLRSTFLGNWYLGQDHKTKLPPWLTPHAIDLLSQEKHSAWPPSSARAMRPGQHEAVLGAYTTTGCSVEVTHSNQSGIDLRHPYRDRRLVEFLLALPAYKMYYGRKKHIVHQAMAGILPEAVRAAPSDGPLRQLYHRGMREREVSTLQVFLSDPQAAWQRYVLPAALPTKNADPGTDPFPLLPWFCVSMEMWLRRVDKKLSHAKL